jgi:dehydratase
MTRLARPIGLLSIAGAFALATTLGLAAPALAAPVPVPFDCQAKPPIGSPQQLTLDGTVQADAPATVDAGGSFEASLAPDPMTVPTEAGGYAVNKLTNLRLQVPVPQGSTFQSATLTGGSNLGTGVPTATQADNVVTVTVPGPIAGGATFQLPALHLGLAATGAAGTTIDTRVAGTSYADPGLTFAANVQVGFFAIDVPTSCFGNPSPVLTSTTIGAAPTA